MNPKVQIPRLKKHLEWLLYQAIVTRQTFNATYAVGKMLYKTEVLLTYGDYFSYSQSIMIENVQLQLSKMYEHNKQSYTIPTIIENSIKIFSLKYYEEVSHSAQASYSDCVNKLKNLKVKLDELNDPINHLKKIRDINLAHLDKSIDTLDKLEDVQNSNPIYLIETKKLIDFAVSCLTTIKLIMFNIDTHVHNREYENELNEIAKAIAEYQQSGNLIKNYGQV
ncbi:MULTISPECIES: AbiU2 domain-containing protein [Leuconostoc]|nr:MULTISPECIES: hypothetical protein [Leuconostoc]AKP36639.1 hypothetical protein NH16_06770 [Leuconostoc mesenteroides subsp. dextranicum]KAA8368926.1 hypothetical protein FE417_04125 [Leuconostoc mesenteroides]KAA8379531.1 hypothetical protein FE413_03995 [Leuconostoc mesenteroides]MBZ1524411.1 hypothetical protein [Leuconostoc mesenteroides]MBZ1528483.1 hypothetical protein [Leuconostoc mesenteroides]